MHDFDRCEQYLLETTMTTMGDYVCAHRNRSSSMRLFYSVGSLFVRIVRIALLETHHLVAAVAGLLAQVV